MTPEGSRRGTNAEWEQVGPNDWVGPAGRLHIPEEIVPDGYRVELDLSPLLDVPVKRHRLTEPEWQAELARAKAVQAKDVDRLITRTPRKRSRWGRPWERKR